MSSTKIYTIIITLLFILTLLAVGSWLIITANGYKINWRAKNLEQTGMIYLKSDPRDVEIYLNNKLYGRKTPIKIAGLLPRRYDVEIKKDDYSGWKKSFTVASGQVEVAEDILLFYNQPKELEISSEETKNFLDEQAKERNNLGVVAKDNEIWWDDTLITRFMSAIKNPMLYPDKKHILFQRNKEINAIEIDGANSTKIVDLSSEQPTKMFLGDNGRILYYEDGERVKKIKIR